MVFWFVLLLYGIILLVGEFGIGKLLFVWGFVYKIVEVFDSFDFCFLEIDLYVLGSFMMGRI